MRDEQETSRIPTMRDQADLLLVKKNPAAVQPDFPF
jgi:hypothetical protein